MSGLEARYRRLLRWYPRVWREAHGEVLLGTAMDAAEAEARSRPTSAEARSMILHGFGERFTMRVALCTAAGALLASFAGMLVLVLGIGTVAQFGGGWIPLALNLLVATTMATMCALALLRHAGLLRPDRVLPALVLATMAWTCTFLTSWSWSVGFDEADAGLGRTPLSLAFGPLLLAGWVIGGATIALVIAELARSLPRAARLATAATGAVVCPPLIGWVAYAPTSGLFIGFGLATVSVVVLTRQSSMRHNSTKQSSPPLPAVPDPVHAASPRVRRRAGVLALTSVIVGVVCAVFALTGSTIVPEIDSTRAMQLGLSAGALAGIPLLAAISMLLTARRPGRARLVWAGMLLIIVGVVVHAVLTAVGATASGDLPWAALLLLAAGVGFVTFALMRATPLLRGLLAAAAALASLIPFWGVLVMAGFILPPVAGVLAVLSLRRATRVTTPTSAQTA